ncbi:MAG: ATP-binding cassette domain-containing protein [Gammaproteobacteria bacterium]|jgi:ABC-2 type transport system ATP-binding protein
MTAMVEVSQLKKMFGTFTAVDDISFTVDKGEVLGFLGPNGAGKSTTMKMITGFLAPDHGVIKINGNDITEDPVAAKARIGYLPEGAPLYSDMNPLSFLQFIAEIRGLKGKAKDQRIEEIIDQVNLEPVINKPIETLSKGFKRRVGLAQAILHDPQVLILDEPTDGLDPNQKYEVRTLIKNMAAEKAIILSTHILEEVHAVCTRAIIISNGKLLADGTPASLEARSPQHNTVEITVHGGSADAINRELEQLSGVKSVEKILDDGGSASFRVYPTGTEAPITQVSHLARDKNWDVENLHIVKGQLDDVFRSITTQQASS